MKRFAFGLILTSALSAPTWVWAQPVTASAPAADPNAALDAAIASERQAIEARDRAFGEAEAKQAAATAAAVRDTYNRESQLAAVEAVEREMATLLDRVEALNAQPQKLLLEQAVLERWYADLQPAVAHLTERSFRGAELELAALAQNGAIEPGTRRIASYRELGSRIGALGTRIASQREQAARDAAALRAQFAPIKQRRDRLLLEMARPDPSVDTAAQGWFDSTMEFERRSAEVYAARGAIDQAMRAVLEASAQLGPPILADVRASVDGVTIYTGDWRRSDGSDPDEVARAALRKTLQDQRQQIETEIGDLSIVQRQNSDLRTQMAERMHRRSGELQRSADRYADKRMVQVYSAIALDVGLTLAEVMITGGTATLARKSVEASEAIAARAAARKSTQWSLQQAIIKGATEAEQPLSDVLRATARNGSDAVEKEIGEMARGLMSKGVPYETAFAQSRRLYEGALASLNKTGREYELANSVLFRLRSGEVPNAPLHELLRELSTETAKGIPAKAGGEFLPRAVVTQAPPTGGAETVNQMGSTAVGEAVEFGLARAVDTALAPAASEALGKAARLRSKLVNGLTANKLQIGVGVAFSVVETVFAGVQDARVNAEALQFGKLMAELDLMYNLYQAQLAADRDLDAVVAGLYGDLARVSGQLRLLDGNRRLTVAPTPKQVSRDARLTLGLGFSAPLASAPAVSVGGFPVAMQRSDGGGQRWSGSIPVASFGKTGVQPVKVAAPAAATSYGALDSNPATPAIRLTSRSGWKGFEPGPDTRHLVPLMIAREEQPPAVASDPFEEGRAMVDQGYGEPGAIGASDLVGLWTGSGYTCEGNEPDELVRVTSPNGIDIIATKLRGDACVRAGEVTWRGRLNGRRIIVKAHMRAPHAAVSASSWVDDTVEVISRDEMTAFGVRYRRGNPPR